MVAGTCNSSVTDAVWSRIGSFLVLHESVFISFFCSAGAGVEISAEAEVAEAEDPADAEVAEVSEPVEVEAAEAGDVSNVSALRACL